jgi:hypothetical protein
LRIVAFDREDLFLVEPKSSSINFYAASLINSP